MMQRCALQLLDLAMVAHRVHNVDLNLGIRALPFSPRCLLDLHTIKSRYSSLTNPSPSPLLGISLFFLAVSDVAISLD